MDQEKITRTLKQWLENERRVVTYRDVSRKAQCHVNLAKNMLLSYHSTHPATATYLLTGPLLRNSTLAYTQFPASAPPSPTTATQSLAHLGGQVKIVDMDQMSDDERNSEHSEDDDEVRMGNDDGAMDGGAMGIKRDEGEEDGELESEEVSRWGVVMVSEDGLEEKKELFEQDKLSIHIYALSPAPVKDPGQYLVSNLALRSDKNYHNPTVYGTISGDAFKTAPEVMRDGGINFGAVAAKKKDEKSTTKKEPPKKEPPKKEPLKKEVPAFRTEREVKAEPVDAGPSKPAVVAEKAAAPRTKTTRRSKSPEKPATDASTSKKPANSKLGPTSSEVRQDEQAAMEAMMDMDMDQDFTMDDDGAEESQNTVKSTEPVKVKKEQGDRKRKRRIVKKSKMEMDDKGYMVTKDYDTEESYSGDSEPDFTLTSSKPKSKTQATAAKPKPAPVPSRTGSTTSVDSDKKPNISDTKGGSSGGLKKGARGQSTLQGFFKKK